MPLTYAQYETLFNDATLGPKLKVFASRLLRDAYKTSTSPTKDQDFLYGLSQIASPAFLDRVRIQVLGELDDAGVALPSAGELGQAARAALRAALNRNDL